MYFSHSEIGAGIYQHKPVTVSWTLILMGLVGWSRVHRWRTENTRRNWV